MSCHSSKQWKPSHTVELPHYLTGLGTWCESYLSLALIVRSQTPAEHLTVHVSLEGCLHDEQWASNSAGITLADRSVSKLDDRTSQILMQSLVVLVMPASRYWSTEFWKSDAVRPPSPQVMIKLEWKAPESCTSLFTISSNNLLHFMLSFFEF